MRSGLCAGCKWIRLLVSDYCELCEDKYGGDESAGIRQKIRRVRQL